MWAAMKIRSATLSFLFALGISSAVGCAADAGDRGPTDENEIVNVPHTDVERQAIGNCWLYAHASWAESMHLAATGEAFDSSQSYWTYWHWFDQIVGGWSDEISTGGSYSTANNIVRKYGLMPEAAFIPEDTLEEMQRRQKVALDALNAALKEGGALSSPESRRDKKLVRAEMDRAWGLSPEVSAMLDRVFGETVSRTFAGTGTARTAGTPILRPQDFKVSYPTGAGNAPAEKTLATAISEWRQVYYGYDRRAFLQRVQRALHDNQPVIITWFVDFNAMENGQGELRGSFNMTTLNQAGPGRQGGHMTVLEDYQAKLSDGTLLRAGETLDRTNRDHAALFSRALESDTEIVFLRVKNSWGAARPDKAFAPGMPGYHDLYLDYLNGPVKQCAQTPEGETDTENCYDGHTPLQNVVLPPGY